MPDFSFLKMPKTAILAIVVIIGAAIFIVLTIKTPNAERQEITNKRKETSDEQQETNTKTSYSTPSHFANTNETLKKIGETAPPPAALKPIPLQEIGEAVNEFAEKSGLDVFGALAPETRHMAKSKTQSADESLPLLFPESYLTYVKTARDLMLQSGVIRNGEYDSFATNAEILAFLPRLIDFFADNGYITEAQRESGKQNITPGFEAMKAEYLQFRSSSAVKKSLFTFLVPAENDSSRRFSEIFKTYFWGWLQEGLAALKIPAAEAFVPLCYKDAMPFNVAPGFNVPAVTCCNCGIKFVGPVPVFVPVCGPPVGPLGGTFPLCDIPLGCLNLICLEFPNAIWDPITLTCGCG